MKIPYERAVLVCVNKRDGGRVSCAGENRQGEEICRLLKERVKSRGLVQRVRVIRSGCLDMCETGPMVLIYPEGRALAGVNLENIDSIVESLSGIDP